MVYPEMAPFAVRNFDIMWVKGEVGQTLETLVRSTQGLHDDTSSE